MGLIGRLVVTGLMGAVFGATAILAVQENEEAKSHTIGMRPFDFETSTGASIHFMPDDSEMECKATKSILWFDCGEVTFHAVYRIGPEDPDVQPIGGNRIKEGGDHGGGNFIFRTDLFRKDLGGKRVEGREL